MIIEDENFIETITTLEPDAEIISILKSNRSNINYFLHYEKTHHVLA